MHHNASHVSDTGASVPLSAALSTAPTSLAPAELDQLPQIDVSFTDVPALVYYLDGINYNVDSVTVAGITPSGFAASARSSKWDCAAPGARPARLRRGDSGGGPWPEPCSNHGWPTLVVEGGFTQSTESLRAKIRYWFAASAHSVKVVVLAKVFPEDHAQKRLLIEQWQERDTSVSVARPGVTMTRSAVSLPSTFQPVCIQTINVVWAVPGVAYDKASLAQRCDPLSFSVVRGPLRLDFPRLFLRQPAGPDEQDIVLQDDELQWYAAQVWDEQRVAVASIDESQPNQ